MSHSFKPIRPLRVSEEVAEQLKQSILLGHFRTGDRLPTERELSEQFQVSRAAIREALRVLENTGFIITRQGSTGGAFVTNLTFERLGNAFLDLFMAGRISIPEMYQVRLLLEPEVARLAAQRATPEYVERLKSSSPGSFHLVLAEMCGNRFYESIVASTIALTKRIVDALNVDYTHPPTHKAVLEAVIAGDADAAAEAMRRHAVENGEELMKVEQAYRERNSTLPLAGPH